MEDSGKRLVIAAVICMAILFGWQYFFAPKPQPKPAPTATTPPAAAGDSPTATTGAAPAPTQTSKCDVTTAKTVPLRGSHVEAAISECGGALAEWKLVNSQYTEKDKAGKDQPKNLVPRPDRPEFYSLQLAFPESTVAIDPAARWELTAKSPTEVEARLATDKLEVIKTYTLDPERFVVTLKVAMKNLGATEIEQKLEVETYGYQDPAAAGRGTFSYAEPHFWGACYQAGSVVEFAAKSLTDTENVRTGGVKWAGINHRYFLIAAAPRASADENLACAVRGFTADPGIIESSLRYPGHKLAPGASAERILGVYIGPKHMRQLQAVESVGGGDADLSGSVDLGWFSFLAKPMLWLLSWFYTYVGNWGIAIILLTITVKLLTLYWTTKSMRSMKAMASLKPKMDELQKKYADDRQRLNTEMMNLYKTHGVNPLGGCLPMLLQMPVWIALYNAINAAGELYQAPFAFWLTDLTRPDPYYIIPVVMTLLMFAQQKLTPTTIDSAQQRMMLWLMPLMFGSMSLFFPSGLTLYILTNSVLTMIHQIYMNRTDPKPVGGAPPVVASTPAAAPAPAKAKKPGGKPAKA